MAKTYVGAVSPRKNKGVQENNTHTHIYIYIYDLEFN